LQTARPESTGSERLRDQDARNGHKADDKSRKVTNSCMSADIKAIVFDFGQVVGLFDHRLTTNRLVCYGNLPADELHGRLFGTAIEDDYESGRLSTAQFLKAVRESCRLSCSEDFLASAWADIFVPNPDLCALIARLKPYYRLLLASNT